MKTIVNSGFNISEDERLCPKCASVVAGFEHDVDVLHGLMVASLCSEYTYDMTRYQDVTPNEYNAVLSAACEQLTKDIETAYANAVDKIESEINGIIAVRTSSREPIAACGAKLHEIGSQIFSCTKEKGHTGWHVDVDANERTWQPFVEGEQK